MSLFFILGFEMQRRLDIKLRFVSIHFHDRRNNFLRRETKLFQNILIQY